jgi:hypothetical protein
MILPRPVQFKEKANGTRKKGEQLKSRWKSCGFRERMEGGRKLLPNATEVLMLKREFAKGSAKVELTPEQEAEAQRLAESIANRTKEELLQITRLLVSKKDHQLFGETEFQVRDLVHKIGARALETAVNERKKGGTKGQA